MNISSFATRYVLQLTWSGTYTCSPAGRLMLCAELDVPKCDWSVFTRLLCKAILKLISNYAGPDDFSWSTGDPEKGIKPHIAIPLLKLADEVRIIHDVSSSPVPLPSAIQEAPESKRLRSTSPNDVEFTLRRRSNVTFRSRLYYVDLRSWRACDLPLVNGLALETFWGTAPLRICVYEEGEGEEGKMERRDVMALQIDNPKHTDWGAATSA